MAALFPRSSNSIVRIVGAVVLLGGAAALAAPMIYMRTPFATKQFFPVDQPVQFDHRHHTQDDGIECRYCHGAAERTAYAGVPSTEVCAGCHSQVWNQSAMLEPVRRSYFSGRPIPWNRVHRLPDYVYFNHAIHVKEGIGCVTCHGRVDRMALVEQVSTLQMGWCLDCHRDPTPNLRPRDRITAMDWTPTGDRRALGRALAAEYGTRRLTSCTTCHR
jgi:hypothetical protein